MSLIDVLRVGGGDEMVVTRAYQESGYLACDLICPTTSAVFKGVKTILGISSSINAPPVPWELTKIPWDNLPRVVVMYMSSTSQAQKSPIIIGVIKNGTTDVQAAVVETTPGDTTTRVKEPGVNDVSFSTNNAKVIIRDSGGVDIAAKEDLVAEASGISLKTNPELPLKSLAVAPELVSAIKPLYDAVNSLIDFANAFPSLAAVVSSAQAALAASGSTLLPGATSSLGFEVSGVAVNALGAAAPVAVPANIPYTPYVGPAIVKLLMVEEFDTPTVLATPRD